MEAVCRPCHTDLTIAIVRTHTGRKNILYSVPRLGRAPQAWDSLSIMRAKSLKFKELLKTDPANGSLYLAENRAVLMEVDALGKLRKELIDNLGVEITQGLLVRYGYHCGRAD